MKKLTFTSIFALIIFISFSFSQGQNPTTISEVAPSVYRIFVNNAVAVVAFTGEDGTVLVDAAYENTANDLLKEIERISEKPLKFIINTHIHGDHTGGNLPTKTLNPF